MTPAKYCTALREVDSRTASQVLSERDEQIARLKAQIIELQSEVAGWIIRTEILRRELRDERARRYGL